MPKVRMEAVKLVKYRGWSTRKVARYTGFSQGAIVKWCQKDPTGGWRNIPTLSSRPNHHPEELSQGLINKIITVRKETERSAEVVHAVLSEQEVKVSLSSVKRTLDRKGLLKKRSPWKRYHRQEPRIEALKPGDLVELDTIHVIPGFLYVYAMIDIFSRWGFAWASERINTYRSLRFVKNSQRTSPFSFQTLQSDHGSEFSQYFSEQVKLSHRHSRVRTPSDNGHVERFNRTLKDECLSRLPKKLAIYQRELSAFLHYYNTERHHFGLNLKKPVDMLK